MLFRIPWIFALVFISSSTESFVVAAFRRSGLNVERNLFELQTQRLTPSSTSNFGSRQLDVNNNGVFLHMVIMAVAALASALVMMNESTSASNSATRGGGGGGGAVHIYMNSNAKKRRKTSSSTPKPNGRQEQLKKKRRRKPINSKDHYPLGGTPGSVTAIKPPKPM